ncbi:MAG: hypothetical protein K8S23_10820 [Candidatus Cloacimonetes bacterium]|nr:hypothetical protein [Candidatus Cloacimonadota bacterium]
MKQKIKILSVLMFIMSLQLIGQVSFDYSGVEIILEHFTENQDNVEKIANNQGYQHILLHSKKYSSNPITKDNLINSLNGKNEGFDFSQVKKRKVEYVQIIEYLKENEPEIKSEYAKLCLKYLPDDYVQKATIYYVIGGYNGIAFNDKICMNIDYEQFRKNYNEIKLYIAHELFHIGFEKYQPLPDVFKAETVKDLKEIVLSQTMNEGLATLTPYQKRIEMNEISDSDYQILLNEKALNKKINQFDSVIKYLDENIDEKLTNEILGNVLGQCSGDRLFYIVGCHTGLEIEEKFGSNKIKELVKESPEKFFDILPKK